MRKTARAAMGRGFSPKPAFPTFYFPPPQFPEIFCPCPASSEGSASCSDRTEPGAEIAGMTFGQEKSLTLLTISGSFRLQFVKLV